jgi:competence protein ComFC
MPLKWISNNFHKLLEALTHFTFPPLCLYCKATLPRSQIFCNECILLLEMIDSKERCPYCFSFEYCPERRLCEVCLNTAPLLNRIGAVFDYEGPAACLIRELKYANRPYLAKGLGAYLTAQFIALQWPMPDLVIPVPMSFTHLLDRGYNQSLLLAKSFAEMIERPISDILSRKSGDFSQAGLSKQQRLSINEGSFYLKKKKSEIVQDKCILLIDDVMTTGTTLNKCAEAILEDFPQSIYALTVCRAIQ